MPMNAAKLLLLNVLGGSAEPVTYLFRDEFTTDLAAGSVNGTAAEPGPGTRTVTDTAARLSLSGGAASIAPGATMSALRSPAISRSAGKAYFSRATVATGGEDIATGISASTTPGEYYQLAYGAKVSTPTAIGFGGTVMGIPNAGGITDDWAFVLRSAGCFWFKKVSGAWQMVWALEIGADATMYAHVTAASAANPAGFDYMRLRDLPAPFDTDNGIATLNVANPANAAEYTGDADSIIDLTVTAPGTLDGSASTRCGFYYRADSDLSPAWHCYVDGTGVFNLDSIDAAGTRTNRISVAGVIAGGGTRTLRVICAGTKHHAYSLNDTTWTKRGAEVNVSLNDTVTTIEPSIPAGWSAANLRSYPRTSPAYAELDRT